MTQRVSSPGLATALCLALAATSLAPSCDNPACALSGNCSGSSNGTSNVPANPAFTPSDNLWVSPAAPTITAKLPSGNTNATTTPLMIVFSESMAPSSLLQAFVIVPHTPDIPTPPVVPLVQLVGDGRLAILLPTQPLAASTIYDVLYVEGKTVTDLQGVAIVQPSDRLIFSFETIATNPATPKVVGSYPAGGAQNQSATSEIVVVFDRLMDVSTVTPLSWLVTVNGSPPADNPNPSPLSIGTVPDSRVWRYRSVDVNHQPVPFPPGANVQLRLSPSGSPIKSIGNPQTNLPTTTLTYQVAPFTPPTSIDIVSTPADAFGLSNFDGTVPLEIALGFAGVQSGDFLGMFVYGIAKGSQPPATTSFFREEKMSDIGFDPVAQTVSVGEPELDLVNDSMVARLAEGEISIGFVVRRGQARTPIRMLDVDPVADGTQKVVLDVTPPTFVGYGSGGSSLASFTSDMTDLTVVGKASEELRSVEIDNGSANNGALAPVVGSNAQGVFVAAPIDLDVIDPALMPMPFTMNLYDRALNRAAVSFQGSFLQVGAVGPGVAVPSASTTIAVKVVDGRTLAPIANAMVFTHEDLGATHDIVDFETTDANGNAVIEAGLVGETTLTVDANGYDLVSFAGLDISRISIPLTATNLHPALVGGTASLSTAVGTFTHQVTDSRVFEPDEPFFDTQSCTPNTQTDTTACLYGPHPIAPGRIGADGFVAFEDPTTAFNFVAATYLRAFTLELPVAAANPDGASTANFANRTLLSDATTPTEERALEGPAAVLDISGVVGLAPTLDGDPRVLVEGLSPGVPGSVLAGRGIALDPSGSPISAWEVRCAIPGAADPTDGKYTGDVKGTLITDGTIEDELYLRCEVRDQLGARTGVRMRFSTATSTLVPPSLPIVITPLPGSTTAGPEYDVVFSDMLPGGSDPGIYRVTLIGSNARRWVLWRVDGNSPMRSVHLPDIAADGGTPLPSGAVTALVTAYAYPGFDPHRFLFSELERRTEILATGSPTLFAQP